MPAGAEYEDGTSQVRSPYEGPGYEGPVRYRYDTATRPPRVETAHGRVNDLDALETYRLNGRRCSRSPRCRSGTALYWKRAADLAPEQKDAHISFGDPPKSPTVVA
jgi:hypothetical protein